MKSSKKAAPRQVNPKDASVVAIVGVGPGLSLEIFRLNSKYGDGVFAAARVPWGEWGKAERALIYRLAAALEEASVGPAPISIDSGTVYIESNGTPAELERDIEVMVRAAKAMGFKVAR